MASSKYELDLGRLCYALHADRQVLQHFRKERADAVRAYAGRHYSAETVKDLPRPVNLLQLFVQVVIRSLVPKEPRVLLNTFQRQNKPMVSAMGKWANKQIVRMGTSNILRRQAIDALFGLGIAKVAIANPSESAVAGWNLQAGEAYCKTVDLDDWVCDTRAKDLAECAYMGHRYRVPLDTVRDSPLYSKRRKVLTESTLKQHDEQGQDKTSALGGAYSVGMVDEFQPMVDLWEIYCPRFKCVYVFWDEDLQGAASGEKTYPEPLRHIDWIGPDTGPYHPLFFGVVPGNLMPQGPIMNLLDLDAMVNASYRKLRNQAEREKEVTLCTGGHTEDGKRTLDANDGDMISVASADNTKVVRYGGISNVGLQAGIHFKDLFVYMAGNLDMMGGLSPQAKTARQDQMLSENASKAIGDMQDAMLAHTGSVLTAMNWFWFHDPQKVMRINESLPGLPGLTVPITVNPQQRIQTSWDDLEVDVAPYSLQHATPQERLGQLTALLQQLLPLMPILQQQSIGLDANALVLQMSEYANMPELNDILTVVEPPAPDTDEVPGQPAQPGKPAETTRNYVRENVSGRTRQGTDLDMMSRLAGADQRERSGEMNGVA